MVPIDRPSLLRWLSLLVLCGAQVLLSGCGGKTYPVKGQVVFEGGVPAKELAGYLIMFQSEDQKEGANGLIRPDGSFTVGTFNEGDGSLRGKQRVAITPPAPDIHAPRQPSLIPDRYGSFDTSKLDVEIKPETNRLTIEVERAR